MNQSVGVSKSRCNANRHDEAKDDTDNTSQRQEDSVLNTLEWTKDEAGVDEHEKVTTRHEESIKEDGISWLIAIAANRIGQNLQLRSVVFKTDLNEALLPLQRGLVPQLQLNTTALTLDNAGVVRDTDAPEHDGGGGGDNVTSGVPGHSSQQWRIVSGVTKPGTRLKNIDSI